MPSSSENQRRSKSHNNKPSSSSSSRRPNNRPSSDADYARRLQEEYRREFIQRRASAPVEEMVIEQPRVFAPVPPTIAVDDAVYARQLQYELEQEDRQREEARKSNRRRYEITPVSNSFPLDEDERLAQEFQDEELARQIAAKPPTPRIYVPTTHPTHRYHSNSNHIQPPPSFPHCNSTPLTSSTASDTSSEEVARRIAQEMDDAEIAHRLARYEQEAQATQRQERQGRSSRVLFRRVLPLLCCGIVVAIALLFILGVFDPQDVPFVGDIRRGDDWVDPFAGDVTFTGGGDAEIPVVDAQEQMGWPTDGRSGISLEILNALEDKWQEVLSTAVDNWDAGFPIDSLTLRITRVSYETVCEAVTGKIKVCNADYGDTRWRGLNELMLNKRTNTIVSSAAKMNEFYLGSDTEDQKLYTMCHELGHGFGLPHWDEDFFNKDMGNCMDYTNNPESNKWPDPSNFLFLSQIYGGVNVTTGDLVSSMSSVQDQGDEEQVAEEEDHKDDKRRGRRRTSIIYHKQSSKRGLRRANSKVILTESEQRRTRRVLRANEHFEVHQVDGDDEDEIVNLQVYLLV